MLPFMRPNMAEVEDWKSMETKEQRDQEEKEWELRRLLQERQERPMLQEQSLGDVSHYLPAYCARTSPSEADIAAEELPTQQNHRNGTRGDYTPPHLRGILRWKPSLVTNEPSPQPTPSAKARVNYQANIPPHWQSSSPLNSPVAAENQLANQYDESRAQEGSRGYIPPHLRRRAHSSQSVATEEHMLNQYVETYDNEISMSRMRRQKLLEKLRLEKARKIKTQDSYNSEAEIRTRSKASSETDDDDQKNAHARTANKPAYDVPIDDFEKLDVTDCFEAEQSCQDDWCAVDVDGSDVEFQEIVSM